MRTWLALDMSFLGYRALYSTGELTYGGEPTGVLYGILREIADLRERFGTDDFVFCFDYGKGLREQEYRYYKESRRARVYSEEESAAREAMRDQLEKLRTDYLEEMGFTGVYFQKGYEADDLMASVSRNLADGDRVVLVSRDADMFQLLDARTACYSPASKRFYTAKEFRSEWRLAPTDWAKVKAIAGCNTDDVPGVDGVGEVTAAKYLRGDFRARTPTVQKIEAWMADEQYRTNLKLVTLPYPGTRDFVPIKLRDFSPAAWDGLCERLGMSTLTGAGGRAFREGVVRG